MARNNGLETSSGRTKANDRLESKRIVEVYLSVFSLCCVRKTEAGVCTVRVANRQWLLATISLFLAGSMVMALSIQNVWAQDAADGAVTPAVTVELNKLEEIEDGCRVYFVMSNKTPKAFEAFNIDLILFRTDGVIGKRFIANIAPLRAERERQVKLFDLDGIKCSEIESFHVNDTVECRNEDGAFKQCFSRLSVSSLGSVKLSK